MTQLRFGLLALLAANAAELEPIRVIGMGR